MVKVSVIIPVYNVENYLEESLDSIVNQTLDDIEIICINDGSTDKSLEILEKYGNMDDRVKVFTKENGGASSARNRGIGFSKGDYIYFMDADDILELNALEELYDFSKSNDLDILIFKLISFNDGENKKFATDYYDMPFLKPYDKKVFTYRDLGDNALKLAVSPPGKLFKRDLISSIRFLEGFTFEDNLFFAEAMLNAERVSFYDEYLYNRRFRPNSVTTSKNIKTADTIVIANEIIDLFKRENVYDDYKKQIIEIKIRSTYKRFSQVDEEYKEEFFQRIKADFSNFRDEFENDDVFKNEIDDVLRYYFRAAIACDNSKDYEIKCELYRNQNKIKILKEKQKDLKKKNKSLEEENNYLRKKLKSEKKAHEKLSNSNSWKLTKSLRKLR